MSDGGFATVNEDLRLQQVYATLINFGGAELADRIRVGGLARRMQRWIYKVPGPVPALSSAVKTRVMLESLGPTYVKLGQIISSQASTLPDDWRVQLDRLQNEVPPVPRPARLRQVPDDRSPQALPAVLLRGSTAKRFSTTTAHRMGGSVPVSLAHYFPVPS